jgi:hypothetical protein
VILVKCETCTNHREVFYRVRVYQLTRAIELGRWPTEWSERKLRQLIRERLISDRFLDPSERIRWSFS